MTHNITLIRYTNPNDDYTKSAFTDKIILQVDVPKSTKEEGVYYIDCEIFDTNSLVRNQAVNMPTGMLQDLGKFELAIKLTVIATRRGGKNNDGKHSTVKKLKKWRDENLQDSNFKEGRSGILFGDFSVYDEIPMGSGSNQHGLIFYDLHWKFNNSAKPPNAIGTLWFVKSRGDGT